MPRAPGNRNLPRITGDLRLGHTLTCDPGRWDAAYPFEYAWLREGVQIATGRHPPQHRRGRREAARVPRQRAWRLGDEHGRLSDAARDPRPAVAHRRRAPGPHVDLRQRRVGRHVRVHVRVAAGGRADRRDRDDPDARGGRGRQGGQLPGDRRRACRRRLAHHRHARPARAHRPRDLRQPAGRADAGLRARNVGRPRDAVRRDLRVVRRWRARLRHAADPHGPGERRQHLLQRHRGGADDRRLRPGRRQERPGRRHRERDAAGAHRHPAPARHAHLRPGRLDEPRRVRLPLAARHDAGRDERHVHRRGGRSRARPAL